MDLENPFSDSKYFKQHVATTKNKSLVLIPKEKADTQDLKTPLANFIINKIDYDSLFNDLGEDDLDVETWASNRLERKIESYREFIFTCSYFKGKYFLNKLISTITELEIQLSNIWKGRKPNWLQKGANEELLSNLKYFRETIYEDFPEIKIKSKKEKNDILTWYELAKLIAYEKLEILKNGNYKFLNEIYTTEIKVCRKIHSYLGEVKSLNSIKIYLNTTKSNEIKQSDSNKNIFTVSRLDTLRALYLEALEEGHDSKYFKRKIDELELSIN